LHTELVHAAHSHVTSVLLYFLYSCPAHLRHLHSFPTRALPIFLLAHPVLAEVSEASLVTVNINQASAAEIAETLSGIGLAKAERSEEHTSELQSREKLVCRLLLEKKEKKVNHYTMRTDIIQRKS